MLFHLFTTLCWANGQSSHLWISQQAIQQLPEGELKALLLDEALEPMWRNGTMFPDGGYAIHDDYGEMAHWEPFQMAYLDWIKQSYQPPWSTEARQHIAFLLGMASHGMADQTYDAMYFRRAYVYDAEGMWSQSFDTATDVALVSQTESQPIVDVWVPLEAIEPIYAAQGHSVSDETILQGQNRLNVAVYWVGTTASQPDLVAEYDAQFPWGTGNQLNADVPGNPTMESEIVVKYWQEVWGQLHNEPILNSSIRSPILFTYPTTGTFEHPKSAENIESSLSIGMARGIDTDRWDSSQISVQNVDGQPHSILVDVFYGQNSHVLNITPLVDWEDTTYIVQIAPTLPFRDGSNLGDFTDNQPFEWQFSTLSEPVETSDLKQGCNSIGEGTQSLNGFDNIGWFGILTGGFAYRSRRRRG